MTKDEYAYCEKKDDEIKVTRGLPRRCLSCTRVCKLRLLRRLKYDNNDCVQSGDEHIQL